MEGTHPFPVAGMIPRGWDDIERGGHIAPGEAVHDDVLGAGERLTTL